MYSSEDHIHDAHNVAKIPTRGKMGTVSYPLRGQIDIQSRTKQKDTNSIFTKQTHGSLCSRRDFYQIDFVAVVMCKLCDGTMQL
jgi:hypothetical protein